MCYVNINVGKSLPGNNLFTVDSSYACPGVLCVNGSWSLAVYSCSLVLDVSMPVKLGVFTAVLHQFNSGNREEHNLI